MEEGWSGKCSDVLPCRVSSQDDPRRNRTRSASSPCKHLPSLESQHRCGYAVSPRVLVRVAIVDRISRLSLFERFFWTRSRVPVPTEVREPGRHVRRSTGVGQAGIKKEVKKQSGRFRPRQHGICVQCRPLGPSPCTSRGSCPCEPHRPVLVRARVTHLGSGKTPKPPIPNPAYSYPCPLNLLS